MHDLLNKMLAVAVADKQTIILADTARMITFYRMIETKPDAKAADLDAEQKRLMDEMLTKLEAVSNPTPRSAFKAALLYFAEQL